ncbi:hypothetical protein ACO2I3_08525 [Leptospira interrogans]
MPQAMRAPQGRALLFGIDIRPEMTDGPRRPVCCETLISGMILTINRSMDAARNDVRHTNQANEPLS